MKVAIFVSRTVRPRRWTGIRRISKNAGKILMELMPEVLAPLTVIGAGWSVRCGLGGQNNKYYKEKDLEHIVHEDRGEKSEFNVSY